MRFQSAPEDLATFLTADVASADSTPAVDVIAVGLVESAEATGAATAAALETWSPALARTVARLIDSGEWKPSAGKTFTLAAVPEIAARRIVLFGLGSRDQWTLRSVSRAVAAAAKIASDQPRPSLLLIMPVELPPDWQAAAVAAVRLGATGQDLYRREKKRFPFETVTVAGVDEAAITRAAILAEGVELTRRLVNEPPSVIFPQSFCDHVESAAEGSNLEIEIWKSSKLKNERCGALLAVAAGSSRKPRMMIFRHRGAGDGPWHLALVGKGVTFDSGGYSLKPSDSMKTMKCDMAGAATVAGAMLAIAKANLSVNVIGLVGLVENLISGSAYKLGDVLHARSGKTIEIHNTDAEGRLVLADVLDVACDHQPERIVDLATLTGACVVALGTEIAGLFSNDDIWQGHVRAAADEAGEAAWPMPMFPEFTDQIQSDVADIKNVGEGRWGGAITAAKFLEEFVRDTPWTHIDIAGPAFLESPKPYQDGGATGAFVRTLFTLAESLGSESGPSDENTITGMPS